MGIKQGRDVSMIREDLPDVCRDGRLPVVRFYPKGFDGPSCGKTLIPKVLSLDDAEGHIICTRTQLPILLGYAFTMHRAQGLTLDKVCFHSQGLFAYGQLYTALSRVRDMLNLCCMGDFNSGMKCAAEDVMVFEARTVWIDVDNGPDAVTS